MSWRAVALLVCLVILAGVAVELVRDTYRRTRRQAHEDELSELVETVRQYLPEWLLELVVETEVDGSRTRVLARLGRIVREVQGQQPWQVRLDRVIELELRLKALEKRFDNEVVTEARVVTITLMIVGAIASIFGVAIALYQIVAPHP